VRASLNRELKNGLLTFSCDGALLSDAVTT